VRLIDRIEGIVPDRLRRAIVALRRICFTALLSNVALLLLLSGVSEP
jgi:hypothetical protein